MANKSIKTKGYVNNEGKCGFTTPADIGARKPPLFTVGENDFQALSAFTNDEKLSDNEKDLITAIFDLCGNDDDQVTDIDRIGYYLGQSIRGGSGKQIGDSGIRKRIKKLENLGLIKKEFITADIGKRKNHRITLFVLAPAKQLTQLPSPHSSANVMQLDLFEGGQFLDELYDHSHRFDSFFCQLLSASLPIDDKTSKTAIETTLYLYGNQMPVSVASRTGFRIPTVSSIKTIIAIITLVEQIIKERIAAGQEIGVKFVVDIGDILTIKQKPKQGGYRRTVVDHARSWEATTFMFKDLPVEIKNHFKEKHGIDVAGFQHFQLLSQLSLLSVKDNGEKHPTHLGFQLPQMLVDSIADQGVFALFTVTPQIMKEQDPFTIAYHMFCRKNIGQATYPLKLKKRDIWKRMASTIQYADFEKKFDRMIIRKIEEQQAILSADKDYLEAIAELEDATDGKYIKQVSVLGYLVSVRKDGLVTTVRDPEDPYVGIKSKHQALKQKTERLASSESDSQYRKDHPESFTDKK